MKPWIRLAGALIGAGGTLPAMAYGAMPGLMSDPERLFPFLALAAGVGLVVAGMALVGARRRAGSRAKAESLMRTLGQQDAIWDVEAFLRHARATFQAVYPLAQAGDVERAAAFLTPGYRDRLIERFVAMQQQGRMRRVGRADIKAIEVIHVDDRLDDTQDRAWAFISYYGDSAVVIAESGQHVEGDVLGMATGTIWKFVRAGDSWLLEDVDRHADLGVHAARVQTEGPKGA